MLSRGPRVYINDTTLRDGEQAPGVSFSVSEKVSIALALAQTGVDEIEAGTPAMGGEELEALAAIASAGLSCRVMGWCRLRDDDIDKAVSVGLRHVNISAPASRIQMQVKLKADVEDVARRVHRFVSYARDRGLSVALGCEDASRADPADLVRIVDAAARAGAFRVRFADTLGILDPFSTHDAIARLRSCTDLAIEFHGHDDLGLATANTLAAIRAGASHASVTVLGLGERAGNAALEEVAVALAQTSATYTTIDTIALHGLADRVARAAGVPVARAKAIVGRDIFTHESGIHVSALLSDVRCYQALDPAGFGRHHRIAMGKHSGLAAVRAVCAGLGLDTQAEDELLRAVKAQAMSTKAAVPLPLVRRMAATLCPSPGNLRTQDKREPCL